MYSTKKYFYKTERRFRNLDMEENLNNHTFFNITDLFLSDLDGSHWVPDLGEFRNTSIVIYLVIFTGYEKNCNEEIVHRKRKDIQSYRH